MDPKKWGMRKKKSQWNLLLIQTFPFFASNMCKIRNSHSDQVWTHGPLLNMDRGDSCLDPNCVQLGIFHFSNRKYFKYNWLVARHINLRKRHFKTLWRSFSTFNLIPRNTTCEILISYFQKWWLNTEQVFKHINGKAEETKKQKKPEGKKSLSYYRNNILRRKEQSDKIFRLFTLSKRTSIKTSLRSKWWLQKISQNWFSKRCRNK